ncbi:MAG: chromosome segregation protein SMC [Phycisphaerae bacterium]|nr:chromosome segregation protein SMC [Phycisphaerae bacterium]
MKLKKLIVAGFKSFADRTEFEFDDGVSCIVGPNGCGKSNVVDAIKWVLGEQSAKSLRGSEMLDVIFNGSSARKQSGMAMVTLEFDNSEGILQPTANGQMQPSETVSVTRRLYRSGQSEYLINKNPARLRDIKEMFLDTGMGASAYSIIEQGRVSQFLQASQEERRAFFDEAAGISRYKARRKEALRKLDRVEQNLLRLQDILAEVEKQLRSIKYQAGKARNFQAYSERLRELRSLYFLSRYHSLTGDRRTRQGNLDTAHDALAAINSRIAQLEKAQSAAEIETAELEQTARDLQSRASSLSARITTGRERAQMQTKRVEELTGQVLSNTSRCEELEARIDDCAKDIATREAELESVLKGTDELQAQNDAIREKHAAGELAITKRQADLQDEKNGVTDLLRRTQQLHSDVHAIGLKRQNLHNEQQRISEQVEKLAGALKELLVEQAQHHARKKDIEEVIADSENKLQQVRNSLGELMDTEQSLGKKLSASREQRSVLAGRIHTLEEMHEKMEGIAEATRRVLQARNEGKLPAIQGMLGDFIQTDLQNAMLVEAALAGADQYLLAAHYSQVQTSSDELREILGEGGSVEIVCMDRITAPVFEDISAGIPQSRGCVLDRVQFEAWLTPAMQSLLGHTFIVDTLAEAALAADVAPRGARFVTRAGEVLEADGRIRLGTANRTEGVIARRSQLTELVAQQQRLEAEIDTLQAQCTTTREQRENLDKDVHQLRTAIYEANFERSECDKRLDALAQQITQQKNEEPQLTKNLDEITRQIEAAIQTEHETKEKVAELEKNKLLRDEHIAQLEEQLVAARAQQNELNEARSEVRASLAAAEQKKLALRDSTASLKRQREEMESEQATAKSNIELDRKRKVEAEQEIQTSNEQVEKLTAEQQVLQQEVRDVAESRDGLGEQLGEIRQQLSERRKAAEESNEIVGNLRVRLSELDAHIGDLISRASDEMQMDLAELLKNYEHDDERDWQAVETEMNELRGKIDRLGNVNLDAISEQEELEQRGQYLQGQLDDITDARKQLEELIRKLNDESRQRFVETFTAVRENFQTLFRKLFGGGKADILLTDPDDVLESGIEIVARPPGKELRSISLLSGGEKTMAALAMIFSFFRAKPSPFCLLDEVDAALDEANTERYNALVGEFIADTQFIMISHAKRTMSIANVLYGVTMQERGVSKRISVRFEEADKIDEVLEPVAM